MGLCRHGEPTACHEIENFRFAPGLDDHGAETLAFERIGACTQDIRSIRRAYENHARRIDAELEQATRINLARFKCGKILAHPEQPLVFGEHALRECSRETGSGRFGACARGKDFVQCAAPQPAMKKRVCRPMAERRKNFLGRSRECWLLQKSP